MAAKAHSLKIIRELNGSWYLDGNQIVFHVQLLGRLYSSYRQTWIEVASALAVIADVSALSVD